MPAEARVERCYAVSQFQGSPVGEGLVKEPMKIFFATE
jgi:hypothetical protein